MSSDCSRSCCAATCACRRRGSRRALSGRISIFSRASRCGSGGWTSCTAQAHGVGYVLSVHEGPQRLHWRFTPGSAPCALQAGMVISNEPGYYQAGAFGIRHENLLLVRPSCETEYGAFLRFENLTMVPFDRDAIDPALLTAEERAALNRYHRAVWETISPHLAGDERAWLKAATEAL